MSHPQILVLNVSFIEPAARNVLLSSLSGHFDTSTAELDGSDDPALELAELCETSQPDVLVMGLPPNCSEYVKDLLRGVSRQPGEIPIMAVIGSDGGNDISDLLRAGIAEFMRAPLHAAEIFIRITRLIESKRKDNVLIADLKATWGLQDFVGESPAFLSQIEKIPMLAQCGANVLITGETGTGKELVARAIHYLGYRSDKPFLALNCAAVPPELAESELFGHQRGAFTGANAARNGLVHDAEGGTVFLDEVNSLPLSIQSKLLRLLQEKEYRAIGSTRTVKADVRVVAASNVSLAAAIAKNEFRQDLYYRLNVMEISLPPLRERIDDIPILACHFLRKYAAEYNKLARTFTVDTLQALTLHEWPGNIRELENIVQGAVVFSKSTEIRRPDIRLPGVGQSVHSRGYKEVKAEIIDRFENAYIRQMLVAHHGNISAAAVSAKKDRRAFFELMRKHRIDPRPFRT